MPAWRRLIFICVTLGLSGYVHDTLADRSNYWGMAAQLHSQDAHVTTDADSGVKIDTETSSFGSRLFIGRFLHRHIAIESGAMLYRTARATIYSSADQNIGDLPAKNEVAIDLRLLASFPIGNTVVTQGYIGQRFWNRFQYFPQTPDRASSQSTEIDTIAGGELGFGWRSNALIVLGMEYMDSEPYEGISASLGIAFRFK